MAVRVRSPRDRSLLRRTIKLSGTVQGLGVRPSVARLARSLGLHGSVWNDQEGVCIDIFGADSAISSFLRMLCRSIPAAFTIEMGESIAPGEVPDTFEIRASLEAGPTKTSVPPDRRTCDSCLAELDDPSNRRHDYPFISCTHCGPRYSILQSMPYDRRRTSMASFAMCERCLAEYEDPDDRRFHSQTNCCPDCGPRCWSDDGSGQRVCFAAEALRQAEGVIRQGGILALKGIGGYQLICDATNEEAIVRLRDVKHRPRKPVAIMIGALEQATQIASMSPQEMGAMQSAAGPIVIVRARTDYRFADLFTRRVHPGLRDVGLMLPTTPLHHWLCRRLEIPLVVSSGNREGEPLVYQVDEAATRLSGLADLQLHHDREIIRPIDDGVVRQIAGRMVTLRAGRGLAPITIPMDSRTSALATGGHQKVAVALCNGHQSVLGPHIGDMDTAETRQRYVEQTESLCQLYSSTPVCASTRSATVHDLHPEYFTTRWAEQSDRQRSDSERDRSCEQESFSRGSGGPKRGEGQSGRTTSLAVQHHHAHVVSGMAEHGWLDRTVLGISMDGTGLGSDGSIWGGEILRCSASEFERVGHLLPFPLPGGEAAIRDPRRVALALIAAAMGTEALQDENLLGIDFAQTQSLIQLLSNVTWCPITTSVGRLFDGVASIALHEANCSYEGELAMRLEAICDWERPGDLCLCHLRFPTL